MNVLDLIRQLFCYWTENFRFAETIFDRSKSNEMRFICFWCPGNPCRGYCRMGSNDPTNTWPKIYSTPCRSFWDSPPSDIYPKSATIILFGSRLGCSICPGNFNNKDQGCRRMCSPNIWNQVYFYDVTFDCKYLSKNIWRPWTPYYLGWWRRKEPGK